MPTEIKTAMPSIELGFTAETRGAERIVMELTIANYPDRFGGCVVITKTGMGD